jgi:3-phytase
MSRLLIITLSSLFLLTTVHAQEVAEVPALVETAASRGDGATSPAIWLHPTDLSLSVIIGADDNSGVGVYDLNGEELQYLDDAPIGYVDVRYNFPLDDERVSLIAGSVKDAPQVALWTMNAETRQLEQIGSIETEFATNGLCLYRSARTDEFYVFVNSEDGDLAQYRVRAEGGEIVTSLARSINVGAEIEGCVVDDELGVLYIGEEEVALWRYGAEPETGQQRRIVDVVGGNISEQIEGLGLYRTTDGGGYLIASDEQSNSFVLYERTGENALVGEFSVGAGELDDRVTEPNDLDVIGLPLTDQFPQGLFVTTDETNSSPNGRNNFKLASWGDIAASLELVADVTVDPRQRNEAVAVRGVPAVYAQVETQPVPSGTDAADDPAIWVNPYDPSLSVIIGSDKTPNGGLVVYNLDGTVHQVVPIGRVNNVDLRASFPFREGETVLVAATNRTENSVVLYGLDTETRELTEVGDPIVSDMREVYGTCLYHSGSGAFYVFVNSANTGETEQYLLEDDGAGRVRATLVREFVVGSQTEGCVADDAAGMLYMGEEAVGVWLYLAEPDGGDEREMIDHTGADGNLIADVEGLALYNAADGGYLIVSSQGSSEFVVYERGGEHAYIGRFVVLETDTIDAVSGTDGIEVTNLALGGAFPEGAFIVQDDLNLNPDGNQNFKFISWRLIADALGLVVEPTFVP